MNLDHHLARMSAPSPAETLREAARRMRERAENATPGPWLRGHHSWAGSNVVLTAEGHPIAVCGDDAGNPAGTAAADRTHIASWHPAVALAVADWLDSTANDVEHVHSPVYNLTSTTVARAVAVAHAYLGSNA